MVQVTKYRNKHVAVIGLAKSGIAALRALKDGGALVSAWDDSAANQQALLDNSRPDVLVLSLADTLIPYQQYPWKSMRALVLSPGIPLYYPQPHPSVTLARKAGVPIIGDIELLYQTCPRATYIGITGTNGKSTTTSLIGHILKQNDQRTEIGGNLGIPALELEPLGQDGHYVLELSSYQLDLLDETHINIAILLNITPDHIDRHGNMEGYIEAKKRVFRHQDNHDSAIIGIDNPLTKAIYEQMKQAGSKQHLIPISTSVIVSGGVSLIDGVLTDAIDPAQPITLPIGTLTHLTGRHNQENIAAAYAACRMAGLPATDIIPSIRSFTGLAHRMQYLGEKNGVTYINDSKATNADSTEKALLSYDNIYWIAGGRAKEGGISGLAPYFPRIRHAFLIGEAEEPFAKTLGNQVPYDSCHTLAKAFEAARVMAEKDKLAGAVILLSPACASFDQWRSFEERGEAFIQMAENVKVYDAI